MPPALRPLPDDGTILALPSPAFDAAGPRLVGGDLIPEPVLRAMEGAWSMGRFSERTVRFVRLTDVWVAKEGLVFDADGALYRETVTQHSEGEIAWAHAAVEAARALDPPPDGNGPVVLCKKRGAGNYGHWLMEMLPKAHLAHTRLPAPARLRFLVPAAEGRLAETIALSLALLGIDPAAVVAAGEAPYRVAELIVVDGLTEHGAYMSPLVMDCVEALARPVVPWDDAPRLFLPRRETGCRRLAGEDAILDDALARGYALVEPGLLPLPDQIAAFGGAFRIVGIMGAAMTNIAFAPPGARVVMLTPAGMPDTFFWFIARLRGLDYTEIRCPQTGPVRGVMPWDADLALAPEMVRWVLDGD